MESEKERQEMRREDGEEQVKGRKTEGEINGRNEGMRRERDGEGGAERWRGKVSIRHGN